MGVHHEDGYSASVEGYFVVGDKRFRLAKTNGCTSVLAEPCELRARTYGQIVVIVDGEKNMHWFRLWTALPRASRSLATKFWRHFSPAIRDCHG